MLMMTSARITNNRDSPLLIALRSSTNVNTFVYPIWKERFTTWNMCLAFVLQLAIRFKSWFWFIFEENLRISMEFRLTKDLVFYSLSLDELKHVFIDTIWTLNLIVFRGGTNYLLFITQAACDRLQRFRWQPLLVAKTAESYKQALML